MKPFALVAAALTLSVAAAQGGTDVGTNNGMDLSQSAGTVCLNSQQVDYTHVADANTVLFHMKDGKIWKNSLKASCPGLLLHGFSYLTHYDEICSNQVPIEVQKTGATCTLGAFTPYSPPATNPG
jgi:hypothetical protein